MAIERGKLGDLLHDNVGTQLGRIAAASLRAIEAMPPWKAVMANDSVRSRFIGAMVGQVRKRAPV